MRCNMTDASSSMVDTASDLSGGGRPVQLRVGCKGAKTEAPRQDALPSPQNTDETNTHARIMSASVLELS